MNCSNALRSDSGSNAQQASWRSLAVHESEQVFQAFVPSVHIALDRSEGVRFGGRGQRREPRIHRNRGNQLADPLTALPCLELHPRLLADAGERGSVHAVDAGRCRQRQRREGGQRLDTARGQPPALVGRDAGNQRQMIDAAPMRPAVPLPVAELAVRDRLRMRLRRRIHVRLEALADNAVVRRVLRDAEGLESAALPAERQVHPLGRGALHLPQQVRVEQQLQQRLAPGDPGELGVDNLVRPGTQRARRAHPQQKIGVAAPAAVLQAALVDHVGAAAHRVHGVCAGGVAVVAAARLGRSLDGGDVESATGIRSQQPLLVLESAPAQQLGAGIIGLRRRPPESERHLAAQVGQMAAGEEAAEVGGGEGEFAAELAHRRASAPRGTPLRAASPRTAQRPTPVSRMSEFSRLSRIHGAARDFS